MDALATVRGAARNLRALVRQPRILAVRREHERPYKDFLLWLRANDREFLARFDFRCVGERIWNLRRYRLVLNWLQDPVRDVDPEAYAWLQELEAQADALGIPIVNRSDAQSRSRKSVQSRLLREAGFDTPPVGPPDAFDFPLVLRSDVEHTGRVHRFDTPAELKAFDTAQLCDPVASPFVETRCADGWYRKYRYFLVGDRGSPRHLQISRDWLVRMDQRDLRRAHVEEELAYMAGEEPHHDLLNRARGALGLDFVCFDFSPRPAGGIVIWEANPFPVFVGQWPYPKKFLYHVPVLTRIFRLWRADLQERAAR
ncbi:MAG: ATP-grasp domain-containing protein [Planctomycetota bacterium]|jgi:hypothetical protein